LCGRVLQRSEEDGLMDVFVGIDIGKESHFAVALDGEGRQLLAHMVANEQAELETLRHEVHALGEPLFAVDLTEGPVALTLAVLLGAGERVCYVSGLAVNRSRTMLVGESKDDPRDAAAIAENVRLRAERLPAFGTADESRATLRLLLRRRRDLVADRTRAIARLRDTLLSYFPGLERAFDFRNRGALLLLCRYNRPGAIRRAGTARIERYLAGHGVRASQRLASVAVEAAKAQSVRIAGEDVAAAIVSELASEVLHLGERLESCDAELSRAFFSHPQAEIILSLPGFGVRLGAELLVELGELGRFADAAHLAAYAGLAPVSRDSGKYIGHRHRARRGNKRLKNVLYHAAFVAARCDPRCRAFYERKRAEGKRHHQTVIALARRRTDVIYAMLKDDTAYRSEILVA
jgi:transposase